jgi:hypothetical protein
LVRVVTQGWPHLSGMQYKTGINAVDPGATPQATEEALARIVSDASIDTVIISHMYIGYVEQDDFRSYPESPPGETSAMAYEAGLRRTVKRLTEAGKTVVYVRSIPFLYEVASVEACSTSALPIPRRQPDGCLTPLAVVLKRMKAYDDTVDRALQGLSGVSVFDTLEYLCDETYCYVQKDGILMYRDSGHLSEAGSYLVGFGLAEFTQARRAH